MTQHDDQAMEDAVRKAEEILGSAHFRVCSRAHLIAINERGARQSTSLT
jgi:hypothetical protein